MSGFRVKRVESNIAVNKETYTITLLFGELLQKKYQLSKQTHGRK